MDKNRTLLLLPQQESRLQPSSSSSSSSSSSVHFERLPIKVQNSASSLSPNGQPFSIVFFFSVESSPTTLWYLESAFTQSATIHEHMELMGTFQPNYPNDPMPFYIYETHVFNINQSTIHEDTVLDIRVQSPEGSIHAEFSYTFINNNNNNNERRHGSTVSTLSPPTSALHSPRIGITSTSTSTCPSSSTSPSTSTTSTVRNSPRCLEKLSIPLPPPALDTLASPGIHSFSNSGGLVEPDSPLSPGYVHHNHHHHHNNHNHHQHHHHHQQQQQQQQQQYDPQLLYIESKDLDTAEHYSQYDDQSSPQTSKPKFVPTYIEDDSGDDDHDDDDDDDDENDKEPDAGEHFMQATSEFFSKVGYWLYNSRVVQYIAREDRTRSKTVFQTEDIWILGVCYSFDYNSRDSRRGWDRKMIQASTYSESMNDNDSVYTVEGSESMQGRSRSKERHLQKQRQKELAKAKKIAQAKERELEREQRARLKEQEERQKLKLKISGPVFDKNNLREGTMDLSQVRTPVGSGKVENSNLYVPLEPDRRARSLHGYQPEERPNVGLGLTITTSDALNQSTIRKARSNSILQGVKSAATNRFSRKKGILDIQVRTPQERTHQHRSQSISNLSAISQQSTGTSSFSSFEGSHPNSPRLPLSSKSTMNVHECGGGGGGAGLETSMLSKLSFRNFSQRRLPDLPRTLDDISSIPSSPYHEGSSNGIFAHQPMSSLPPGNDSIEPPDSPSSTKSGRRRMTIATVFKEPKSASLSGMAALKKTLANSSRISLRLKPEEENRTGFAAGTMATTTTTTTFAVSPTGRAGPSNLKKNGIANWIGWRRASNNLSSNNLHQQVLNAVPDELDGVPGDRDMASMGLSQPSSPMVAQADSVFTSQTTQEGQNERITSKLKTRLRKKGSISAKSLSSITISSPIRSTMTLGSPQTLAPNRIPDTTTTKSSLRSSNADWVQPSNTHKGHELHHGQLLDSIELPSDITGNGLLPGQQQSKKKNKKESCSDSLTVGSKQPLDISSFAPPTPTESFVLLTLEKDTLPVCLENGPEESVLVSVTGIENDNPINTCSKVGVYDGAVNQQSFGETVRFPNNTMEGVSDMSSERESRRQSKHLADQKSTLDSDYVHIKKLGGGEGWPLVLKQEELQEKERERIRKIGSAYIKVKSPSPAIIAPQPRTLLPAYEDGAIEDGLRVKPPMESTASSSLEAKFTLINSATQGLHSPVPASLSNETLHCLDKTLRSSASRPQSPGYSQSVGGASVTPMSSRSSSSEPGNGESTKQSVAIGAKPLVETDPLPRTNDSLTAPPQSPSQISRGISGTTTKLTANQMTLQRFSSDFQSKLWFTYRKDMARLEPSFFNSDAGWGCMMRTGQSLLAQAFVNVMLGRDWGIHLPSTDDIVRKYRTLLGWFADEPERHYSIHNIAKSGLALDKRVGEWFGPSTVAHALRRLSQRHPDCPLSIMVPMDNTLRTSDIIQAATDDHQEGGHGSTERAKWTPIVILLPARYGLEKLTERYIGNLKRLFRLPQFLGIAGGRPGRSLYFVACQGSELFYFDPHFVKTRATQEELSSYPSTSYHCNVVRTMDILELDPSMMLGFLIQSLNDLVDLSARLKNDMEKGYPLLTILEDTPLPSSPNVCKADDAHVTACAENTFNDTDVVSDVTEGSQKLATHTPVDTAEKRRENGIFEANVVSETHENLKTQGTGNIEIHDIPHVHFDLKGSKVREMYQAYQGYGSNADIEALEHPMAHEDHKLSEALEHGTTISESRLENTSRARDKEYDFTPSTLGIALVEGHAILNEA
ncbi:Cysteine protease atg4b, partial [Modicella reniformis]